MKMSKIITEMFSKKKKIKDEAEKDNKCSICIQDFDKNTVVLECGHLFHFNCLITWSKNNTTCPLCRRNISIKSNYSLERKIKIGDLIPIIYIISFLIILFSLISSTRTSSSLKMTIKKIYNLNKGLAKDIFQLIKLIVQLVFLVILKGLSLMVINIVKNLGYTIFILIKIIFCLLKVIIIILLGFLLICINVVIDSMNLIVFINEKLFKVF